MACQHVCCNKFRASSEAKQGSAIVVIRGGNVLLGKERWGKFSGRFGMFKGKMIESDQLCWIKCAVRELEEESRISLTTEEFVEHIVEYTIMNGLPVFTIKCDVANFRTLSKQVKKDFTTCAPTVRTEITTIKLFPQNFFIKRNMHCKDIIPFSFDAIEYYLGHSVRNQTPEK